MRNCKSILLVTALMISSLAGFAQQNRIIIWDITRSMIGVSCLTPPHFCVTEGGNIDGQVREGIKDIINDAKDDGGEFRILTFRESVIDNRVFDVSNAGKNNAKAFVNQLSIKKDMAGATNICGAWEEAMKFVKPNQKNVIYLFTDGHQSSKLGGNGCLNETIEKYCRVTAGSETFGFYITLNLEDNTFSSFLNRACSNLKLVDVKDVKENGVKLPVTLSAKTPKLTINLNEDVKRIERFSVVEGNLPSDFTINASLTLNPEFSDESIDIEKVEIKNSEGDKVDVELTLGDPNDLGLTKHKADNNLSITGIVTFSTPSGNVSFSPSEIELEIVNEIPPKVVISELKRIEW